MPSICLRYTLAAIGLLAAVGCVNSASNTDLYTDGPPSIAQVRLDEEFANSGGVVSSRTVFGFGTHPMASADEEHAVTSGTALGNKLRIIVDHLLQGSRLQEIKCRDIVGPDGAYSTVPDDDTPDDIAHCAVASDALKDTCPGKNPRSVCICQLDGGCGVVAKGDPVGVLDDNQDGAADLMQLIPGSVGIKCGNIDVPIDLVNSYWNPSGNQEVPAKGGFDALGPAIVIVPATAGGSAKSVLPTNVKCGLTFAPTVVDKRGVKVCAPPNGDFRAQPYCTPGDVSQFSFTTEPLLLAPEGIADMGTVPAFDANDPITITSNVPIDPNTVSGITIVQTSNGAAVPVTITVQMGTVITLTPTGATSAMTEYTITIPTTVTDTFGQGMPNPVVVHFFTM